MNLFPNDNRYMELREATAAQGIFRRILGFCVLALLALSGVVLGRFLAITMISEDTWLAYPFGLAGLFLCAAIWRWIMLYGRA